VTQTVNSQGRVDEENNVYVFDNGSERKVGQYPGVSMQEALAYFERKFSELEANVRILEQRVKSKADAASISKAAQKLSADLAEPAAVGNIQELRDRVASITPSIEQMKKDKSEASEKAALQVLATRRDIAAKAQELAEKDPKKTQWKAASAQMNELFEKWQQSQKDAPRISRKDSEPIWKTFSQARTKFEANKRAFFSALSAESKNVRAKKTALVTQAEALVAKGADSASEYRKLLDQWKLSGRSQGAQDDQLWERFKAAGDSIYAVRKEVIAKESVEFKANYEAKLLIIAEAEKLDPLANLAEAKKQLLLIQNRYDKAGKVPKDKIRETDDRMRAVDKKIKDAEQENWRKSDPAAIERTNGVLSQLEQSIAKLELELKDAEAANDSSKIQKAKEALEARKSWLTVVKQNAN
jgi:ribosomal protein S17E